MQTHQNIKTFKTQHTLGAKGYELSNHLGNVQVVVTDKKFERDLDDDDTIDVYAPSLTAAYDYYPFGMLMPGRYVRDTSKLGWKHGFNTQTRTDEIAGVGNHYTALFWEYDSRLGRRWNIDPVDQISISNYSVNGNNPIFNLDPLGNKFKHSSGGTTYTYERKGKQGAGFYANGKKYSGDNAYLNELSNSLNDIGKSKDERVLGRFTEMADATGFDTYLMQGDHSEARDELFDANGNLSGMKVSWNSNGIDIPHGDGAKYNPTGTLVHEVLGHAWQSKRGFASDDIDPSWHPNFGFYSDGKQPIKAYGNFIGLSYGERDASSIENNYLRSKYLNGKFREAYHGKVYRTLLDLANGDMIKSQSTGAGILYSFPVNGNEKFLNGKNSYDK